MTAIEPHALWTELAACRGDVSHLFFAPPAREAADVRAKREKVAKSICARCPVRSPCLAYALRVHETLGIWGGTTEAERRQLQRGPKAHVRQIAGVVVNAYAVDLGIPT
jgi:WhiB family redox-sensing transcriptional regulator